MTKDDLTLALRCIASEFFLDDEGPGQRIVEAADEIDRLTRENVDLHEQVALLQSREVCTVAHDDVETCGYCQRDHQVELFGAWQVRDVAQGKEIKGLQTQLCEWLAANAPGGWIDNLRKRAG
jgi:hypothetical protein